MERVSSKLLSLFEAEWFSPGQQRLAEVPLRIAEQTVLVSYRSGSTGLTEALLTGKSDRLIIRYAPVVPEALLTTDRQEVQPSDLHRPVDRRVHL